MGNIEFNKLVRNFKNRDLILTPLIDEYYMKKAREQFSVKPGWIRPSMLGNCKRYIYYAFLGMKGKAELFDPRTMAIFQDGDYRHKRWEDVLQEIGIVKSIEQNVKHEKLRLNGTYDAIIEIDEEEYLIDFKGANDFAFKQVSRSMQAGTNYLFQLHAYMIMTKIKKGIIWYDNKNTQEYKEIIVPYDAAIGNQIKSVCKEIIKCDKDDIIPPRECEIDSKQKQRCSYAYICW